MEVNTLNAQLNMLATFVFSFTFQVHAQAHDGPITMAT